MEHWKRTIERANRCFAEGELVDAREHYLLPLSLSYDHRVINGAAAARFTQRLSQLLGDIRTILL